MSRTESVSSEFPIDKNAQRIPYNQLKDYMSRVFLAVGLPKNDAEELAIAMADGDLLG